MRSTAPADVAVIAGVSALEFDGVDLHVHWAGERSGRVLLVNGVPAGEGLLRVGDTFIVGDPPAHSVGYRVLVIQPDLVTLERIEVFDRSRQREGVHRDSSLIRVAPYDHKTPVPAAQPPATSAPAEPRGG